LIIAISDQQQAFIPLGCSRRSLHSDKQLRFQLARANYHFV